LHKKLKALKQSFDELNATHERLVEAHEKLDKAHKKLEKAYSTLLDQSKKEDIVTCDVSLTCDIIDESFYNLLLLLPLTFLVAHS
jgi:prefoldin subunit 5